MGEPRQKALRMRIRLWLVLNVFVLHLACGLFVPGPGVAQDYTIGPGDVLSVTVWGQADLSRESAVGADGFVPFPLVGRVKASGLTSKEIAARLAALLGKD